MNVRDTCHDDARGSIALQNEKEIGKNKISQNTEWYQQKAHFKDVPVVLPDQELRTEGDNDRDDQQHDNSQPERQGRLFLLLLTVTRVKMGVGLELEVQE